LRLRDIRYETPNEAGCRDPMTEQERELIKGCVNGEKSAWDAFVQQYSNLVFHTIRKTLTLHHVESRDELLEDLYQEFFIAILQNDCRKLSQFRGDGGCTLASFLRVVASRLTIDHLRKQPTPTVEVTDTFASDQRDAPGSLIDSEEQRSLTVAIESLSAKERLLVELHFRQGLPAEEVASILKISPGTFYTQKSRLVAKLRESLSKS
jgi:RNA polymerase sigma factor (sigma-70 family)